MVGSCGGQRGHYVAQPVGHENAPTIRGTTYAPGNGSLPTSHGSARPKCLARISKGAGHTTALRMQVGDTNGATHTPALSRLQTQPTGPYTADRDQNSPRNAVK